MLSELYAYPEDEESDVAPHIGDSFIDDLCADIRHKNRRRILLLGPQLQLQQQGSRIGVRRNGGELLSTDEWRSLMALEYDVEVAMDLARLPP